MPTIEQNIRVFDDWSQTGDEWSDVWGGTSMEWYFFILPRIHSFVPAQTILEIGPGHGRWTGFLAPLCQRLIAVDVSEKCVQVCREKFKDRSNISCYANDGKSLDMVPDGSIDFVFSFDSLVHAEEDVLDAYLRQLSVKLKKNGTGVIHHSNIGAYRTYFGLVNRIPQGILKRGLIKFNLIDNERWRAHSMTADKFRDQARKYGLQCTGQEIINWGTRRLIDCISIFVNDPDKKHVCRIIRNADIMKEAKIIRSLSALYSG